MNALEKKLKAKILEFAEGQLQNVTPSIQIQAFYQGRKKVDLKLGNKHKYYDLASLTKIFFTTTAFMRLSEKKPSVLKQPIGKLEPSFKADKANISDLLTHTAGLPWWAPFY